MKVVKAKSSKFINEKRYLDHRFQWQTGYGVFTYNKSIVSNVYHYIERQETHHAKKAFIEEYLEYLEKFEVDYDPEYIFKELE
jgi:hypothetical protein